MRGFSLTSNQLKIIAIAAMVFDHFVAAFLPYQDMPLMLLRVPGRVSAPIMCFLIAEGFHHTSNLKKYALRLFFFALLSHLPFNLCFGYGFFQATSVMWSLLMGLLALAAVKAQNLRMPVKLLLLLACCLLAINANWNYVAVLWIVVFGLFHGNFRLQAAGFCVVGLLFHLLPNCLLFGYMYDGYAHLYQLGIFLVIPLLYLYKGQRGRKSKFLTLFFYGMYPAHLLLFYILRLFSV